MSCRHCPFDSCRDVLCQLEVREAAFRRRLRLVLVVIALLIGAMINFAGPLQRVELYRTQPTQPASVSGGIASFAWIAPSPSATRVDPPSSIPTALPPGYAEGWPAVAAPPESPAESAPAPIAVIPPVQRSEPPSAAPVPPSAAPVPEAVAPVPRAAAPARGTGLYRHVAAPQPEPLEPSSPPRKKRQTLERSDPIQMLPPPVTPAPAPSYRPVPNPSAATAVPPPLGGPGWIEVTHPTNDGGLHRSLPRVNPAPLAPAEAAIEIQPAGAPFERPAEPAVEPAEDPEDPSDPDWQSRVQSVLNEARTARYSPDGTNLKTGLSPGGLVQWVFRRLGYRSIPQLVDDQMEMTGTRVPAASYRPQVGDLLFYRIGNAYHVGIYFDADQNTFLTVVPSKGGAVITAFDHPFFRARFQFARRLAPALTY